MCSHHSNTACSNQQLCFSHLKSKFPTSFAEIDFCDVKKLWNITALYSYTQTPYQLFTRTFHIPWTYVCLFILRYKSNTNKLQECACVKHTLDPSAYHTWTNGRPTPLDSSTASVHQALGRETESVHARCCLHLLWSGSLGARKMVSI